MSRIKEKYEYLYLKAISPKSVDCARGTIYRYEKNCKACNAGIAKPERHDKRDKKYLFKKGFCSLRCLKIGANQKSTFEKLSTSESFAPSKQFIVEDLAFASLELQRQNNRMSEIQRMVSIADRTFNLISEKLAWLEKHTGEMWYPVKFYRILKLFNV